MVSMLLARVFATSDVYSPSRFALVTAIEKCVRISYFLATSVLQQAAAIAPHKSKGSKAAGHGTSWSGQSNY